MEKRVLPKLFSALERPNNIVVLYTSLIPFLSRLPQANYNRDLPEEEQLKVNDFYNKLLASFRKGAEKELGFLKQPTKSKSPNVHGSTSYGRFGLHSNTGLKYCIKAYFECVIYGLKNVCGQGDGLSKNVVEETIKEEHCSPGQAICAQVINIRWLCQVEKQRLVGGY